jgi:hypothetical protein
MLGLAAAIHVDPAGYQWVRADSSAPPEDQRFRMGIFLRAKRHAEFKEEADDYLKFQTPLPHTYDPFEKEPALFQIFARLQPEKEPILHFANKYGDIAQLESLNWFGGMDWDGWTLAIRTMKNAVELLNEFTDDSRRPKKPSKHALNRLQSTLFHAPLRLEPDWNGKRLRLRPIVINLLDVMRIQLASAFEGHKQYRDCDLCGKPFELAPQINRADKVFCSANCRVKAYQRRKKQVIELRKQGDSLRAIVKESGSELETVKKWIAESEEKEKSGDEKAPRKR